MTSEKTREQYLREFLPGEYLAATREFNRVHLFYQKELHSIFNSPVSDSWRTLLDVGCGPMVASVFPATRNIDTIVLSDLVPRNREEVMKWIQRAPDAMDWSFMSAPLAALEGCEDAESGAKDIEERTRAAIKKVIPCDVLDPNVLPEEHKELFDVVHSSLCLATASPDEETFQRVMQNVSGLIRKKGHLILCGTLGSREYSFGGVTFPDLHLTKAKVEGALRRSGFQVKHWRSLDRHLSTHPKNYWDSAFVVLAQKA